MQDDETWLLTPRPLDLSSETTESAPSAKVPLLLYHVFMLLSSYAAAISIISTFAILLMVILIENLGTTSSPGDILFLLVLLLYVNLMLWICGIGAWRTGQWANSVSSNLHDRFTPPHNESIQVSEDGFFGFDIPQIAEPAGTKREDLVMAGWLTVGAITIVLAVAVLILVFDPIQNAADELVNWLGNSSESNDGIGLIAGIFSVLLGRAMGLVALSAFFIADSPDMIALFLMVIVLPGVFLEPASENILNFFSKVHYDTVKGQDLPTKIAVLLLLSFVYIGWLAFLIFRLANA